MRLFACLRLVGRFCIHVYACVYMCVVVGVEMDHGWIEDQLLDE